MPDPGVLTFIAPRKPKPPQHLADLTLGQRRELVVAHGHPAFRADQISRHWLDRLRAEPATWTDIPAAAREELAALLTPPLLAPVRTLECDGGTTLKTVWRLHDGALVESVLMRYGAQTAIGASAGTSDGAGDEEAGLGSESEPEPGSDLSRAVGHSRKIRTTVCISSQAGCGMNCPFCATGQAGLTRNLSVAEIVEQVTAAARTAAGEPGAEPGAGQARAPLPGGPGRVTNVVFMGMGEPLANYKTVIAAVRRINAPGPEGLGISARGITVSTVGLAPRIRDLADEGLPVTLAVSLHAPDDELRDTLVPINTRYPLDEVVAAAGYYARTTGRRVSIEYALIREINDQGWRADLLATLLLRHIPLHLVHVNPIPLNPTPGSIWTASKRADEAEFVRRLRSHGIPVTVRDTRGREIDGACGQLAAAAD